MDFELSEDERVLAEAMRRLCEGRFPLERIRSGEGRSTLDAEDWSVLGDAGVFSLRRPEAEGGAELGTAAAAVVFEELGRALVPGPLVASHVAAGLVKGAASGERPVVMVRPDLRTSEALPLVVGDLGSAAAVMVVGAEDVRVVAPEEIDAQPVGRGIDPLTPLWQFNSVPDGTPMGDADSARRLWREFEVLTAALLVGISAAVGEMAAAYAKARHQFDRPIGAFQAVKHLCADMLVRTETARAAVHAAAVTLDQPEVGDPDRAAAGAALLAGQAAQANAKSSIQVHGGMGFTWEVPVHLYLMRARVLIASLGPAGRLADVVAEHF